MQQSPNKSPSHSLAYYTIIQKPPFCRAKVWFLACKKGVFTLQKYGFCNAKVGILCILLCHNELQVYVGAHFYGVCRYVNNHKMRNEHTCVVEWIYVFDNVDIRVRGNEYVYLIMWKYGRDESVPYAWRNEMWGVSWLNVDILRNVRGIFRGQTWYCWQTTTPKIIDITTVMLCAKNNTEHKKTHFGKTKTNKRNIKNGYTISSLLSIDSAVFTVLYKKSTIK